MDVSEFGAALPRRSQPIVILEDDRGLEIDVDSPHGFVPPSLTEHSASNKAATAVLIDAPAAAGKSTCARAIAHESGALLADFKRQRVADGSFLGLLHEGLGEEGALLLLQSLRNNTGTVILDSLDETSVKSGTLNFIAFLLGICRFLRSCNSPNGVVMLARSDTADWIVSTFDDEGIPLRRLSVDFFDKNESEVFMDLKLDELYADKLKTRPIHRINRQPYSGV